MKSVQKISETTQDRILEMDLSAELKHGVVVSNLAYDVAKELGLGEKNVISWLLPECSMI